MEIGSGFWARLFVGADAWSMRLSDDRLYVRRGSSLPAEIDLTAIQKVEVIRGSFWSTIVIHDGASVHRRLLRVAHGDCDWVPPAKILFERAFIIELARCCDLCPIIPAYHEIPTT